MIRTWLPRRCTNMLYRTCSRLNHLRLLNRSATLRTNKKPPVREASCCLFSSLVDHSGRDCARCAHRNRRRFDGKIVVIVQIAIEVSRKFGCFRSEGGASTLEEDHSDNPPVVGVGVGREPAKARAVLRASAGLAQYRLFHEIATEKAGSAIFNGA